MTSRYFLAAVLAATFALLSGCEDDSTSGPGTDLNGVWTFFANAGAPPTTLACSAGHSGLGNMALCGFFAVDLQGSGGVFAGTSPQTYCGADFSVAVAVSGGALSGEIVSDDGTAIVHIAFTGIVSGDIATIDPSTLAIEGLTGNCTMTGLYDAVR